MIYISILLLLVVVVLLQPQFAFSDLAFVTLMYFSSDITSLCFYGFVSPRFDFHACFSDSPFCEHEL